jgi:uncharacterized protein (DUF1786 family)
VDERILAIDVGAGTQDILIFDPGVAPENCYRLVMPSRTQIVAEQIREATRSGQPVHLSGLLMGGGASTSAIGEHLRAGLSVSATAAAARTVHNDLERVRRQGVLIIDTCPPGAMEVELGDVDLGSLGIALEAFGISLPGRVAIAVQDHGVRPGSSNNDVRGEYLDWLVRDAGTLEAAAFTTPPPAMTRMRAVQASVPGAIVMDTGAAALLGAQRDPVVAAATDQGAVIVNIGNMHTFAALLHGRRVLGVFEHHTGGLDAPKLSRLVSELQAGRLSGPAFRAEHDGHGAAISDEYLVLEPFELVAVTGPNRALATDLGWYFAAPHGDMMLTGSFGLADGYVAATDRERTQAQESGVPEVTSRV